MPHAIDPPNWLLTHRAAIHSLATNARELEMLADAFELTGNDNMANKLERIVMEIEVAYQEAEGAISTMINDEFQDSMANIGKTFDAILSRTKAGT